MPDKQITILELWPRIKGDMELFISDRPGWLISALKKAHDSKGTRGWQEVETVINILQFLKDTVVEY